MMKLHLLLIDGNPSVLSCFTKFCLAPGNDIKCTHATSIEHARSMLDYLVPDLLFISLEPDAGNSFAFIISVRKITAFKNVVIVVYSGNSDFFQHTSKASGASVCIPTPDTSEAISEIIRSLPPIKSNNLSVLE